MTPTVPAAHTITVSRERCENCRFVRKAPNTGLATFFTCQRYPPNPAGDVGQPAVARAGWCGEWKPKTDEYVHEVPSVKAARGSDAAYVNTVTLLRGAGLLED